MAFNVTLTLPDGATALRIARAICGVNGYTPTNDADASRYARQKVVDGWRELTLNWEISQTYQTKATDAADPINGTGMVQS